MWACPAGFAHAQPRSISPPSSGETANSAPKTRSSVDASLHWKAFYSELIVLCGPEPIGRHRAHYCYCTGDWAGVTAMRAPVRIYEPPFTVDHRATRIGDNVDYTSDDLFDLVGHALYEMAGKPRTIAYGVNSAHLRVLSARLGLGGVRTDFIESDLPADKAQKALARLGSGQLDLLVCRRPHTDGPKITGITAAAYPYPRDLLQILRTPASGGPRFCGPRRRHQLPPARCTANLGSTGCRRAVA
jgi:hypothetical protein